MIGAVVSVLVLLAIGLTINLLLYYRNGPFAPFSSFSAQLGLDQGAATLAATVSPIAATAAASTPAASQNVTSASTSTQTATPSTPAAPPAPIYIGITGADMPGQDMTVTGDNGNQTTSQGTYGPSGCTAICSNNAGCVASVYAPSSKTCWIKSGVTPTSISGNSDRLLQIPSTGATGVMKNNYNFVGNDTVALVLPSSDYCSSLCQALPWKSCQGSTYDMNTSTCHIKAPAQNMTAQSNMVSWMKNYVIPP